jgi:hypothetical protein
MGPLEQIEKADIWKVIEVLAYLGKIADREREKLEDTKLKRKWK